MVMVRTPLKSSAGSQVVRLALVVVVGILLSAGVTGAQKPPGAPVAHPTVAYKPPLTNDWANWKRDCHKMFTKPGKDDIISCATDTFRNRPFHFVAQTVVPGSGVGGRGFYVHDFNNHVHTRLELTSVTPV